MIERLAYLVGAGLILAGAALADDIDAPKFQRLPATVSVWGAVNVLADPRTTGDSTGVIVRHTFGAVGAPGAGDDVDDGYGPGSWWCTASELYVCKDSTAGAASWQLVDGSSGGGSDNATFVADNFDASPDGSTERITITDGAGSLVATIVFPPDTGSDNTTLTATNFDASGDGSTERISLTDGAGTLTADIAFPPDTDTGSDNSALTATNFDSSGDGSTERISLTDGAGTLTADITFPPGSNNLTFTATNDDSSGDGSTELLTITDAGGSLNATLTFPAGGGTSIYTGNGTLNGPRTVTGDDQPLEFLNVEYFEVEAQALTGGAEPDIFFTVNGDGVEGSASAEFELNSDGGNNASNSLALTGSGASATPPVTLVESKVAGSSDATAVYAATSGSDYVEISLQALGTGNSRATISSEKVEMRSQAGVQMATFHTENHATTTFDETGDLEFFQDGKGIILRSPNGTLYRVTVTNGGTLVTSAL